MFRLDTSQQGFIEVCCGEEWTGDDQAALLRLSEDRPGGVLLIDITQLELAQGFTLLFRQVLPQYQTVIVVCGSLENRVKMELLRLISPALPVVVVHSPDEARQMLTVLAADAYAAAAH